MEKNVKLIIIVLVIAMFLLAITGGVLYFTTDLFKSNEKLFQKYVSQNIKNIANVFDVSTEEKYIDYIRKNDYTENTEISLSFLENDNDQEEIYKIQSEGIVNNTDKELYKNIKANYGQEELANIELLRQNEIYGFRLSNLVQQFISIENATMYYVVSNLGYNGKYFQEKMKFEDLDFTGLFDFSEEEIQKLKEDYFNVIFSDINPKSYSSKSGAMITLTNKDSITAKQYSLTLSKTELDKIYKKVLNQAINDQIILSKLEKIDNEIKEMGINEPEGESLKERYITKLKSIHDSIEYLGQNDEIITFDVYQLKGKTYRTSMKTKAGEYIIDLNEKDGIELNYKTIKLTEEGEDISIYSLGKKQDSSRHFSFEDSNQSVEFILGIKNEENIIKADAELIYKSEKISQLKVDTNTVLDFSNKKRIETGFDKNPNIILNNYESDVIDNLFENLKNRAIKNLEEKQAIINTKMINNLLLWIDKKEVARKNEEQNNLELIKQRFNNKFVLYEGENVNQETLIKLLETAGKNMTDIKVLNGKQIEILIKPGENNEEKAKQIIDAISKKKYSYNIKMQYNEEGYINAISISLYEKK